MNHKKFKPIAQFPLNFKYTISKESEFKIPYEFRIYIQNLKAHRSMHTKKLYTKIKFLSGTKIRIHKIKSKKAIPNNSISKRIE